MPIAGIAKRRLGTNPRRRFLIWYQSGHFTAKPPAKKQVFVQYLFGGPEGDRTLDLRVANAALSQLSHEPICTVRNCCLLIRRLKPNNTILLIPVLPVKTSERNCRKNMLFFYFFTA